MVSKAVEAKPSLPPTVGEVRDRLVEILGRERSDRLSEEQARRIRSTTKITDGWRHVREGGGKAAFPRGDAAEAARRLLPQLAGFGLFVVPCGELEGWDPTIGGHGSSVVQEALERRVHETNLELRSFVRGVAQYLASGR